MPRNAQKKYEYNKRYREANREKTRAWHVAHHAKHKDARNAARKQARLNNLEEARNKDRVASFVFRKQMRDAVLLHLGNQCVKCGCSDWRALQIDHVKGTGTKARLHKKSFTGFYREVLGSVPGNTFQLLCANCNQIKRYEENEGCGTNSKHDRRVKVWSPETSTGPA